jgi:drug/metabolite transporter (DMT)-like permease
MNRSVPKTMTFKEWLLLILLSVIWGGSFFFNKIALTELPTFTVVLGRIGLGGILLLIFVYATGHAMPRDLKTWRTFAVMGLMNNFLPFSLIVWGQTHIASGLASILNSTTPFFTVILAHLLTQDERITPNKILGVLLGLVGVSVMIGLGALKGLGNNIAGQVAVLGAALCYAMSGIYGRRLKKLPPITAAAGQVVSGAILLLPLALYVDRPWNLHVPGLTTFGAVLGLAFLSTAVAYIIYFRLLATAGPTNVLLVTLLVPVTAVILGTAILGERLAPTHFLGMGLIALGLAAVDGRLFRLGVWKKTVVESVESSDTSRLDAVKD